MVLKLVGKILDSEHVSDTFYIGADKDHLQLAGTIIFRTGEYQLFGAALLIGVQKTMGHMELIIEDPFKVED